MQYIEVFYNRRRLHSTLDYRTPPKPGPPTTLRPQPRPEIHKEIVYET